MRIAFVAMLSLAGIVQVVRAAVVTNATIDRPALAAKFWPNHPRVQLALAMAGIGSAAAAGKAPGAATIAQSMDAARRAPLAIEPFLIRGAIAQSEGQQDRAERLFVEAVRRDPRSSAGRFFLAQRYLSSVRPAEGLRQAAVLIRLVAGGSHSFVPAIALYAKTPGAGPGVRSMFAIDPTLRDAVLADLARDSDNYRLIMSIAGDEIGKSSPLETPSWQSQLLTSLVERGDFVTARALWLRISGLRVAPVGLFNPQFGQLSAPAPFNWTFGSDEHGVAEPTTGNGLQVIYYGRTNADFATQTLLLSPGQYELRMRVLREGGAISGLAWTVACQPAGKALMTLPVGEEAGAARMIAGQFAVPVGCASQQIRLAGTAREFAASEQVTLSDLELVRRPP